MQTASSAYARSAPEPVRARVHGWKPPTSQRCRGRGPAPATSRARTWVSSREEFSRVSGSPKGSAWSCRVTFLVPDPGIFAVLDHSLQCALERLAGKKDYQ